MNIHHVDALILGNRLIAVSNIAVTYFCNDVHQAIKKERPGKLSKKVIPLHENAHPYISDLTAPN
jgi:hypothetical protein